MMLSIPSSPRRLKFRYLETREAAVRATFGAGGYYYTPAATCEPGDVVLDRMSVDPQWRSAEAARE